MKNSKEKVIIYTSNYGLPLSRWDRFTNKLWYYTAEQEKLWAKFIYYPLNKIERLIDKLELKEAR